MPNSEITDRCEICGRNIRGNETAHLIYDKVACVICAAEANRVTKKPSKSFVWVRTALPIFFVSAIVVFGLAALRNIQFRNKSSPVVAPFYSFDTAMASFPNLPRVPDEGSTDLTNDIFADDYEKWTKEIQGWGDQCYGMNINLPVRLEDARRGTVVDGSKYIELNFVMDRDRWYFKYVINVRYQIKPSDEAYWAKISKGTRFEINGKVSHASALTIINTLDKQWRRNVSRVPADLDLEIYIDLISPATITPVSNPVGEFVH